MTIHVSKEEHDAVAAYVEGTLSPLITMLLVKQLSMAAGFLREEIAKTAAQPLKAEQAKDAAEDAELLDWLEERHYALHPVKEDQGDDTYTLWWQVTDKDKSISGHPLGNIRAAIRAARAAERKA